MIKRIILSILLFHGLLGLNAQPSFRCEAIPFIHSHNDYLQKRPLLEALEASAKSIEIDVFLFENELIVAHTRKEIKKENTLYKLYLQPLIKYLEETKEVNNFHLMIDIKSEAEPTLNTLEKTLKKYPEFFFAGGIQIVISGNRPQKSNYTNYSDFIWFDGREPEDAIGPAGEKVAIISQNLSRFTRWRGEGNIPEKEKQELLRFISDCHAKNKAVRFWNTGDSKKIYDFMYSIKADYINTDNPGKVKAYLKTKK